MYPRNAASPEPIAIGPVVQISDGAVQTAGVTVRIKPVGVAEADGAGTTAYSTDGVVLYTPTQAETNYTSFVLIAKKTGCIPASVTVVTTASATAGYAGVDWGKVMSATSTVNLSGTTISTSQAVASVSGAVGSVTGAVGSVTNRVTANADQWGGEAVTGMPMPTYTQPTGFLAATFPATVSSYSGGAVASVTGNVGGNVVGSVGSISGVTFPTHFDNLDIAANGHVTATVDSINNNAITASSIQANAITAAKIATDAIGAAQLASDAVTEIQSGLATAANLLICNDRVAYALTALVGACSDAQTAAETYTLSINGSTFTVDYAGLDASGNRGTTTLSKV